MTYNIKNWGAASSNTLFQVEPEFGIDGYMGILETELRDLQHKIECEGIGKEGEKYTAPPLPSPKIEGLPLQKKNQQQSQNIPQWRQRYIKKKRSLGLRRLLKSKNVKYIKNLINRYIRAATWVFNPPVDKILNHYPLGGTFKQAEHFLCMSESFWLANKKFIMHFFSNEQRTIISRISAPFELNGSLAVPLQRFNMDNFEGWLRCQNLCSIKDSLFVINEYQAKQVTNLLTNFGQTKSKCLIVGEELSKEVVAMWTTVTQVDKRLWCTEGLKVVQSMPGGLSQSLQHWPKISVVVVSYNQAEYIQECLESILNQGYSNLECIVIDGLSTDGTVEILELYRKHLAHLVIEPDECQSEALNKGFRLATGDIMTWICSDDFLEKKTLYNVATAFNKYETDMVVGGCRIINALGKNVCNHHNGLPFESICNLSFGDLISFTGVWEQGLYFYQPDVFFSKRLWQASGGYIKEHLYFAMDYDLFLRFAMAGATIIHIPEYLATRRIHDNQKTRHETMTYLPTIRNLIVEYQKLMDSITIFNASNSHSIKN